MAAPERGAHVRQHHRRGVRRAVVDRSGHLSRTTRDNMSVTIEKTSSPRAADGDRAARRPAPGTRTRRRPHGRDNRAGYTFLLPWLIGFIGLTAGPMIASL